MNRAITIISIVLLIFCILPISAGPLQAPKLIPGQFVYAIPNDFDPPIIGRHGMQEIENTAKSLHYPYYVVLIEKLPESLLNSMSEEDATAAAVDGLASDWSNSESKFDVGKSSIFILSYDPRQYRFLAGATWKSKLGFERDAHKPYTDLFDRSVQGTPKDPKTGIIEMMIAADNYLFDQTDPARIEARRIEQEKEALLQKKRDAANKLDTGVTQLNELLQQPRKYLPADVSAYEDEVRRSRSIRLEDNTEKMTEQADKLVAVNDKLSEFINKKKSEQKKAAMWKNFQATALFLFMMISLIMAISRLKNLRKLRKSFNKTTDLWDEKLLNAKTRYADFYGNERDEIIGLSDMTGETKELYDKVTAEVDEIYTAVEAMDTHVSLCKITAGKGTYFNLQPIRQAIKDMENEFEFDTGELDPGNLFEPLTKKLKIKPSDLSTDLDNRYATIIDEWEYLKRAVEIRLRSAEELFPHSKLDDMLKSADEYNISHSWIKEHPLFGSYEEDQNVYNNVNMIRSKDPVAFMRHIDEFESIETKIEMILQRLIKSIKDANESRSIELPELKSTVLLPQDDPRLMHDEAHRQDEIFIEMISGRTGDLNIEVLEAQAQKVCDLYKAASAQAVTVNNAIDTTEKLIAEIKNKINETESLTQTAELRLTKAQNDHSNTRNPISSLEFGRQFLVSAKQSLEFGELKLTQIRHMEAYRNVQQSNEQIDQSAEKFNLCIAQCDELDRQKAMFIAKTDELISKKESLRDKIRGYGGNETLEEIPEFETSSPMDYLALIMILEKIEQNWNEKVRQAQREYEAEQAAIRQRREAEARRNRSNRNGGFGSSGGSNWSGGGRSSGSSWGGGGRSSSSGSSWGGGGRSSSSGGKW